MSLVIGLNGNVWLSRDRW